MTLIKQTKILKRSSSKCSYSILIITIAASFIIGFLGGAFYQVQVRLGILVDTGTAKVQGLTARGRDIVGVKDEDADAGLYSHPILTNKINVCFTPPAGCGALIVKEIAKAQKSIYLQAFNFYSSTIADALIDAKSRGVKVRAILDKTNRGNKRSQMARLQEAGIETMIDSSQGIAHNKVMIIDGNKVVTGSFNFSDSADTRNAENVVLIEDKDIAARYQENWMSRYASSKPLK